MGNVFIDHSFAISPQESSYNAVTIVTRWHEWLDSSKMDHDPKTIQGSGLRQTARFPRADRSVPGISEITGSIDMEFISKTMGLLLGYAFGTGVSTNVSGGLYQELFTAQTSVPAMPSFTAQEGIVRADGTIEAYTTSGCVVKTIDITQAATGPTMSKFTIDGRQKHRYRTVTDSVTNGTTTVTSATANFGVNDVGRPVTGTNIGATITIVAVVNSTTITISSVATGSGSGGTLNIGSVYVTPSYASAASLFTSAIYPSTGLTTPGPFIVGGTVTVPTTTALGSISGGTTAVGLKSWGLSMDNGLDLKREVIGGRNNPVTGLRKGTLTTVVEYDATTGALLADWQAQGTYVPVLLQMQTTENITAGNPATLQICIPKARLDKGALPAPSKGDTVVQSISWSVLDTLVGSGVYLVTRTADAAL